MTRRLLTFSYVIFMISAKLTMKTKNETAEDLIHNLNGQIILIRGNHDRFLSNTKAKNGLAAVKDYDEINVTLEDGTVYRCVLNHYFILLYNGHRNGAIHLHGHSHFSDEADSEINLAEQLNAMGVHNEIYNVGCMYWNYEPVTLDEIIRHGRTIRPNYGSKALGDLVWGECNRY